MFTSVTASLAPCRCTRTARVGVIKPCFTKASGFIFALTTSGAVTRMPRFPLPEKFEDGNFAKFRKSFVRVAKANGWSETEQLASLPLALGGRAFLAFEKEEAKFKTISDALSFLDEEFHSARDKEAALKEFYSLRWGVGLSPEEYAAKLLMMLEMGLPSLGADDRDRILVGQFMAGFPSALHEKLQLLFAGKSSKLSEVVAAANDLLRQEKDATVCSTNTTETNSEASSSNDLSAKVEELTSQVAAIRDSLHQRSRRFSAQPVFSRRTYGQAFGRGRSEKNRCFNCSGFGHFARDCPSPRNFRPENANAGRRLPATTSRPSSTSSD